jgi:hypothetical protein
MATFVLVHGSWAGSVVWRERAPRLRKAGHEVYAPTLTGIGARKHLLNREIDLDTHIQDVIGVIDDADLSNIVLVGHSYGGMVTSGPQKCNHQECADEDDIPQHARYGRCDGCQPLLTRYHHGIQVAQRLVLHQLGMVSARSVPWMRNGVVGTTMRPICEMEFRAAAERVVDIDQAPSIRAAR